MPAGTIALTNNSATVTGTGTSFTTELKVNDFLVSTVGGLAYTLGVKSIESNTSLTLMERYTGPSATGQSWTPVPYGTMAAITAQLAAQVTNAIRGLNLDKANWQQIFTGTGTVTVTLPDGTSWQGPAWNGISTAIASKLDKSQNLSDLADKQTSRANLGVSYGNTSGTVAQGNDSRLNTINAKSGGTISSAVTVNKLSADGSNTVGDGLNIVAADSNFNIAMQYYLVTGQYHKFRMVQNGMETLQVRSSGAVYASSFNPTSDSNLKFNKKFIEDAIIKYVSLRGMTYQLNGEKKAGIIAQDAEKFLPESVSTNNEPVVLEDGTIINHTKSLDYGGTSAVGVEAFKALFPLMLKCIDDPQGAKDDINNIIKAINFSNEDANITDLRMEWSLLSPPAQIKSETAPTKDDENYSDI